MCIENLMCIKTIGRFNRRYLIMNGNLSFFARNSFFIRAYCIFRRIIVVAVALFRARYKIDNVQQQRDKNWILNSEARQEWKKTHTKK